MLEFLLPIKSYIVAAVVAVVSIFMAVFTYRGNKITSLKKDIVAKDNVIAVTAKAVEDDKKAAEYVADNRVAKVKAEEEVNETNNKYAPGSRFYL